MLRALSATLAALCLCVLAGSCVDLLDVDNYAGATHDLCETLTKCFGPDFYPACRSHSDPRLASATSAERQRWLTMFADSSCLETCAAARACLDEPPVCGTTNEQCSQTEACCGFTSGDGNCLDGDCCKPDGIACDNAGECCFGDCSMPVDADSTYCGGFVCIPAGETCAESHACCTGICIAGRCSDQTCLPVGSDCNLNKECCDGQCEGGDGSTDGPPQGTCVQPQCVLDGGTCTSAEACCSPHCVTSAAGVSVCNKDQCLPEGIKCTPGENECCSGMCDPTSKFCVELCNRPGEACASGGDCCDANCNGDTCACYADGASCQEHDECCSGTCDGGFCSGEVVCPIAGTVCTPGDDTCCPIPFVEPCQQDARTGDGEAVCCETGSCAHTVCVQGGPLLPACGCAQCPIDNTVTPPIRCIQEVCSELPHCCCFGWDQQCVTAAKSLCGAVCPIGGVQIETAVPAIPKEP